jgi:hypothetical protein
MICLTRLRLLGDAASSHYFFLEPLVRSSEAERMAVSCNQAKEAKAKLGNDAQSLCQTTALSGLVIL